MEIAIGAQMQIVVTYAVNSLQCVSLSLTRDLCENVLK